MIERVEVEGLAEFQRAVSRAVDRDVPREVARVHKEAGGIVARAVNRKAAREAVGGGRGATVRPSATRREVVLRVGGGHRPKPPLTQWGRDLVRLFQPAPTRPSVLETAVEHTDEILALLEAGYLRALAPPFERG